MAKAPDLKLKISGCPNGCGQHHVAGLGFQGSVRKVGGKALPQYFVMLGGGVEKDGAHFGRIAAKIPARRIPEAVERLIALYGRERRAGEAAAAFFRRIDAPAVSRVLGDLEKLTAEDAAAGGLRGPGRGPRVRGRDHGRRVQRLIFDLSGACRPEERCMCMRLDPAKGGPLQHWT